MSMLADLYRTMVALNEPEVRDRSVGRAASSGADASAAIPVPATVGLDQVEQFGAVSSELDASVDRMVAHRHRMLGATVVASGARDAADLGTLSDLDAAIARMVAPKASASVDDSSLDAAVDKLVAILRK